jgi:hypothetical protein
LIRHAWGYDSPTFPIVVNLRTWSIHFQFSPAETPPVYRSEKFLPAKDVRLWELIQLQRPKEMLVKG